MRLERRIEAPAVIPLTVDRARAVGAVLARAFHDDPVQARFNPDPQRRAQILPITFTAVIRATAAYGGHMTTTDDYSGAALWSPPGKRMTSASAIRGYRGDFLRMLRLTNWSTLPATISLFSTLAERRKTHMPRPHWYLQVLGVDPRRHGEGLGSMLVREGLDRADADGTPAYLETETRRNVRFYENHGFVVVDKIMPKRLGLPMWLMVRDAK